MIEFCILATPRSSSTALAISIESSTNHICCLEPFNPEASNWLKQIPGNHIFSRTKYMQGYHNYTFFKTVPYFLPGSYDEEIIHFCRNFHSILLYREDIEAATKSYCIAEHNDIWNKYDLENRKYDACFEINQNRYDFIFECMKKYTEYIKENYTLFSVMLTYEELCLGDISQKTFDKIEYITGPLDKEKFLQEFSTHKL